MDDYKNIPQALKVLKQWVVWKNDGKKIPVNPITLGNAQSNNPTTWGEYADAINAVTSNQADGIGFMFNNDFIGVDLDDCLNEQGKAKPWAKEILNSLYPAYMERSTSGKGIHIIFNRTLSLPGKGLNVNFKKYGLHDQVGGVEMYENGRYFIMTGKVLNQKTSQIIDSNEHVLSHYIKYKTIADRKTEQERKPITGNQDIFEDIRRSVKMDQVLRMYGIGNGKANKVCCPFHSEKTPSFHIYDQDYYCFGCQEYGDAVTFVRKKENLGSNFEAAKLLIEKMHLNIDTGDKPYHKLPNNDLRYDSAQAEPDEVTALLKRAHNVADIQPYNPDSAEVIQSGLPNLDKLMGGFEMGNLTVWTGMNAAGKSTILGQIMIEGIEQNYNVFTFSGELQAHKFQYWLDLQAAGREHLEQKVSQKTGKEYYSIKNDIQKKIHNWYRDKIWLYDNKAGMSFSEIIKIMDVYCKQRNCRIFLIDNVMRLDLYNLDKDEYRAQSKFINAISDFAQTRNVHVHVVAHPRKVFGNIITKADISGSGDLTNRADNVLAVHRITTKFKAEFEAANKKTPTEYVEAVLKADNAIEIFKTREAGAQDVMIPLNFHVGSKRLVDVFYPEMATKQYGWIGNGEYVDWEKLGRLIEID